MKDYKLPLVNTRQLCFLIAFLLPVGRFLETPRLFAQAAKGDLFRLSNTITLGISEKAAIENLKSIALQIAAQERVAREEIFKAPVTEDRIFRAYGVLKYARMIDTSELWS